MSSAKDADRQKREKSFWDKYAPGYDNRILKIFKNAYDLSIQKVCSILSPDQQVLDMGCGTGIISIGIAPYVNRVIATDLSSEMISVAKGKARNQSITNVDFRVGDSYALPFPDESFDVVLLFNSLHIVKEPAALLREAHRLLRPGGRLVSATDCYAEPVPFRVRLLLHAQKLLHLVDYIPFVWDYRIEELRRLFEQNAFVIEDAEILHPAPVNYYVEASKRTD